MRWLVLAGVLVLASVLALAGHLTGEAEPTYEDLALGPAARSRLDFSISAGTPVSILSTQAIQSAARFVDAPPAARVRSARLALYHDPLAGPRVVWLVDIDGISVTPAGGGPFAGQIEGKRFTRAILLVSAEEPDLVVASYAYIGP